MKVGKICVRNVIVAAPGDNVRDAARRMKDEEIGSLVIVDPLRRPLGIVTDRDLMVRCIAEGLDSRKTLLDQVMSGPAVWTRETTPVADAVDEMARLRLRRLPVVDPADRLVGMLALDDVLVEQMGRTDGDSPLLRALRNTM